MRSLLAAVPLLCGAALALQVGANSQLRGKLGSPVWAGMSSFATGTLALAAYLAITRAARPATADLGRGPWWMWVGGLLGAGYIVTAAAIAPRLGAAGWLSLLVAGQVVSSVVLDHYGLVGFAVRPLTGQRIAGVLLMLAGVALVARG